jgi:hypothetical protein
MQILAVHVYRDRHAAAPSRCRWARAAEPEAAGTRDHVFENLIQNLPARAARNLVKFAFLRAVVQTKSTVELL